MILKTNMFLIRNLFLRNSSTWMAWNQKFGDNFFSSNAPQLNLNEFVRNIYF